MGLVSSYLAMRLKREFVQQVAILPGDIIDLNALQLGRRLFQQQGIQNTVGAIVTTAPLDGACHVSQTGNGEAYNGPPVIRAGYIRFPEIGFTGEESFAPLLPIDTEIAPPPDEVSE